MSRIVIVGGGISGLASAGLLARDGHQVTLLEAHDEVGGRAGSWRSAGFRWDTGPSWYLMPEVFDHFFELMGTSSAAELDLVPLSPAYRVFSEGFPDPIDVESGRDQVETLFEQIEPGSGPRLNAYLDSAAEAYELAVGRFLYDGYTSMAGLRHPEVLQRAPRLASLLATPLSTYVERRFRDPRLRQILGYPAVFLGGSPFRVPSLYHLMSHLDLADGVLYPQGGFRSVIDAIAGLAARHGAAIRTGARVERILVEDSRARGVELADGTRVAADIVVSTADLHHTETALLESANRTYPQKWWDKRTPGPGALLILLGVEGELPQLAHHSLLFTEDWRANFDAIFGPDQRIPDPASLYVCRPSATDPTVAPAGHENLFVLVPIPADPTIGRGGVDGAGEPTVEAAADAAIAQIARWAGIPDLASRIRVRRTIAPGDFADDLNSWQGTALGLAHTLWQSAVFRPRGRSAKVEGLLYAGGSSLPGIGLPMCLISAELALKSVRGDRSPGRAAEPTASEV